MNYKYYVYCIYKDRRNITIAVDIDDGDGEEEITKLEYNKKYSMNQQEILERLINFEL